ncbi:MAG: hypothetical protein JSW66_09840 [Phycisphaerales bacterium]|nr:MAG: hypothetical protein JSW66_09840 [Phycisphaerales bacterium]
MSNVMPPPVSVSDIASIGRDAANKKDRRVALDSCLNGVWVNRDIGRLERVDTQNWHGWKMWKWKRA